MLGTQAGPPPLAFKCGGFDFLIQNHNQIQDPSRGHRLGCDQRKTPHPLTGKSGAPAKYTFVWNAAGLPPKRSKTKAKGKSARLEGESAATEPLRFGDADAK
jgi:hypothetical protein